MKYFNRIFVGLVLAFSAMAVMSLNAQASVVARSPKHVFTYAYSVAPSSVTPFTVYQSTLGFQQPGAVYELNLSTGASGDYVVLFDTIPVNASSLATTGASAYMLGTRFFYGSTSANTKITFDPPLLFYNGLMVMGSSTSEQMSITYEEGRGLTGQ